MTLWLTQEMETMIYDDIYILWSIIVVNTLSIFYVLGTIRGEWKSWLKTQHSKNYDHGIWTHWKRLWCWERLKAGGEGNNRGLDSLMASLTQCTWVWTSSSSWWWTSKSGMLQSIGSHRVGHDWGTELNSAEGTIPREACGSAVKNPLEMQVMVWSLDWE